MKLVEMAGKLDLEELTPEIKLDKSLCITSGHASDLLSDVLANAASGSILVTVLAHMNVIAVALNAGITAVIFSSGMVPNKAVRQMAAQQELPLYGSKNTTFDVSGRLYALGLREAGN